MDRGANDELMGWMLLQERNWAERVAPIMATSTGNFSAFEIGGYLVEISEQSQKLHRVLL